MPGAVRVDRDAVLGPLLRRGLREPADRPLRGGVMAQHREALVGGDRRSADDLAAVALLDHLARGGRVAEEDAAQVDRHQLVEVLRGDVEQRGDLGDPGVGDHHVQASELTRPSRRPWSRPARGRRRRRRSPSPGGRRADLLGDALGLGAHRRQVGDRDVEPVGASRRAMPRPIPRAPPVMSATRAGLPLSVMLSRSWASFKGRRSSVAGACKAVLDGLPQRRCSARSRAAMTPRRGSPAGGPRMKVGHRERVVAPGSRLQPGPQRSVAPARAARAQRALELVARLRRRRGPRTSASSGREYARSASSKSPAASRRSTRRKSAVDVGRPAGTAARPGTGPSSLRSRDISRARGDRLPRSP